MDLIACYTHTQNHFSPQNIKYLQQYALFPPNIYKLRRKVWFTHFTDRVVESKHFIDLPLMAQTQHWNPGLLASHSIAPQCSVFRPGVPCILPVPSIWHCWDVPDMIAFVLNNTTHQQRSLLTSTGHSRWWDMAGWPPGVCELWIASLCDHWRKSMDQCVAFGGEAKTAEEMSFW